MEVTTAMAVPARNARDSLFLTMEKDPSGTLLTIWR